MLDREKIAIGVDLRIRGGVRDNSMHKKSWSPWGMMNYYLV